MESERNMAEAPIDEAPAWTARKLLRAARVGTLATSADGQPYAALVTPATDADGSVLLLLSDLSEHTKHLRADPRCAIMVAGPAEGPNPQTAPRLSVSGRAELADAALQPLWLARHPYAAMYADFGDFALWRIVPHGALLVAGFARAHRLRAADLAPEPMAAAAVAAAAQGVMDHVNADHATALAELAGPGAWRMVAVDVDGGDLSDGAICRRIAWPAPVVDAEGIRAALIACLQKIRA